MFFSHLCQVFDIDAWRMRFGVGYVFASGRPYGDPGSDQFLSGRTKAHHNISLNATHLTSLLGGFTVIFVSLKNPLRFDQILQYRYSDVGAQRIAVTPSSLRTFFAVIFISFGENQ